MIFFNFYFLSIVRIDDSRNPKSSQGVRFEFAPIPKSSQRISHLVSVMYITRFRYLFFTACVGYRIDVHSLSSKKECFPIKHHSCYMLCPPGKIYAFPLTLKPTNTTRRILWEQRHYLPGEKQVSVFPRRKIKYKYWNRYVRPIFRLNCHLATIMREKTHKKKNKKLTFLVLFSCLFFYNKKIQNGQNAENKWMKADGGGERSRNTKIYI